MINIMNNIKDKKQFAIGTWEIDLQTEAERKYIYGSLRKVCNYIDTALNYNNDYILRSIADSDVKIISKLASCHINFYDLFVESHLKCLARDKIDIMLIHSSRGNWRPLAQKIESDDRFIEKGVSNFNISELEEYKMLIGHYPAYNELEINPHYTDVETIEFCKRVGIKVIAYGIYGGKYNAMTNIADFSIPYLLKYAAKFADILILKPESFRQTDEVIDVIDKYDFDDGNDIVMLDDLTAKSVVPMRYDAKNVRKTYKGIETYSNACGSNKATYTKFNIVKTIELPKFEMRGDYLAYVRYLNRTKYDGSSVYDVDFLIGDDNRRYVVHLVDANRRLTKIHGEKDMLLVLEEVNV